MAQLLAALHLLHHLGPVGAPSGSSPANRSESELWPFCAFKVKTIPMPGYSGMQALAVVRVHGSVVEVSTHLSFSRVSFCVLLSTLFSPGARGGGGGGGALGTSEGSGGGAGTATIKHGMHPSGRRLFSAKWWVGHSLQVVQVGARFGRWALEQIAGRCVHSRLLNIILI